MNIQKTMKDFLVNYVAAGVLCPNYLRYVIYKMAGFNLGIKISIKPRNYFGVGKVHLMIGEGSFINYNCWFDLGGDITLGENCNVAMNVTFMNSDHEIGTEDKRAGRYCPKAITVGKGTWIGANVTIMPGVTIGSGCIIAAGSVVTKDCEDNMLYAGVPAKMVKLIVEN